MKNTQLIELTAFDGRIPSELSADYILPDTYPDVKRILRVSAKPILIGRYISGRRLEFSGAVDYSVIFSADTENGESMHCVHFAGDFDGSVGDLDNLERASISVIPTIGACSVRMANPRKLTLKSTVNTGVKIIMPTSAEPSVEGGSGTSDTSLEKLFSNITARRERTFLCEPLRISENFEADTSKGTIDDIISCTAQILFNEAKVNLEDSTVTLKGIANVNCVYKSQTEAGVYKSFSRKIPVAHTADAAEYCGAFTYCRPETLSATANAVTIEMNANAAEDSYGERRVVEFDMSADVTVGIVGGEDVSTVLDAYSTSHSSDCTMKNYALKTPDKIFSTSFSVSESLTRDQLSLPENCSIIDTQIEVVSPETSTQRGRLQLSANAMISCIIESDGTYSAVTATIPIKCDLGSSEISSPICRSAEFLASDVRTRTDSDGIHLDFEIYLCAAVCEDKNVSAVSEIRLSGEGKHCTGDAGLTLCYPSGEDTLWQIAKRYKTTVAKIEEANVGRAASVLIIPNDAV